MEMIFDAAELELDIKALEMLPADEPEGLMECTFTCTYTCGITEYRF